MNRSLVLTAAALLAALAGGLAVYRAAGSADRPAVAAEPSRAAAFRLGDVVWIREEYIILGVTPIAAATVERFELADDAAGLRELRHAGLSLPQLGHGRARIIGFHADPAETARLGTDTEWVQIRRIDGEYEGTAGWIDARFLARR